MIIMSYQSIINEIQKTVNNDSKYTDNLVNKIDTKLIKEKY